MGTAGARRDFGIWGYAAGYFLAYAPYSALTKAISQGKLPGMARGIGGFEILPITTIASLVGMLVFLTAKGWWQHAGRRTILGVSLPVPGKWTFLSGLATAAIIGTTTLSYTFSGVSIVFMMLLMRGGVLVVAPIVDVVSRRHVRWFSWLALALSLSALVTALSDGTSYALTAVATIDVLVYVASYFIRLRFMSRLAKSADRSAGVRYFVEEQMVATPAIVLTLIVLALVGRGEIMLEIRRGFTEVTHTGAVGASLVVGLLSQGTGIFGGLILLDGRENAFCVPVNRASSVLAGIVATGGSALLLGSRGVPGSEIAGATMVLVAIAVLPVPTIPGARRAAAAPAPAGDAAPGGS